MHTFHTGQDQVLTRSFFLEQKGHFRITLTSDSKYPMKYEDNLFIHSLVWIDGHILDVINRASFIELDCSFYVFKPYEYCIPQGIICNESVPLGISIGPSESHYIYDNFYHCINEKIPEAFDVIKTLPILSDEGKALKKFAEALNLIHFFCYRHIINKKSTKMIFF